MAECVSKLEVKLEWTPEMGISLEDWMQCKAFKEITESSCPIKASLVIEIQVNYGQ